jgi:hypothetical protein
MIFYATLVAFTSRLTKSNIFVRVGDYALESTFLAVVINKDE